MANNANTNAVVHMEFYDILRQVDIIHSQLRHLIETGVVAEPRSMMKAYVKFWKSIGEESLSNVNTMSHYLQVATNMTPQVFKQYVGLFIFLTIFLGMGDFEG